MTLEEIETALNQPGFSIMKCCRSTGLHPNTLYRIKNGKAEKPHPFTFEALEKYIKKVSA